MNVTLVLESVIPALEYGGTERVVWYLGRELSKLNHKVTFIARKGSYCDFAEIKCFDSPSEIPSLIPAETDIVHFHSQVFKTDKPYVVTMHGNIPAGQSFDQNTIFVSRNHAERHNAQAFVYNGLDWDDYGKVALNNERKNYHFLAKAAWRVKNVKGAIDVIKRLEGEKLIVMGGYRFNFKMGMRFTFTPKADFKGIVGGERKHNLLKQSKGLIFPVLWHEPFGLAVTESLYFGCPVFATPYGSLQELVPEEVGVLTNSVSKMAEEIKSASFSRQICHEYARDNFNSRVMAEAYIKYYEKILNGEKINMDKPIGMNALEGCTWVK